MRTETDSLGAFPVPEEALYGIHTARALANFPLSGMHCAVGLVRGIALVKFACARTNADLGYLDAEVAAAIADASLEMAEGGLREAVVVDALQGGAGTSLNMNVNEVLANRAEEILGGRRGEYRRVHPLHHVNLHQSTNDVFPTALRIAAIEALRRLEKAIAALQSAFQVKEQDFAKIVKVGRTQLQDACPMTLGSEVSAWSEAMGRDRWRVFKCEERLRVINLGGTAIGTGLTAPRDYIFRVIEKLREVTKLGLARAENLVDATQNADVFVEVSGILKAHAVNLFKISSDLRLLASGPHAGLAEVVLPSMQVGSSVMPGKVNPVICEAVGQSALQVMSQDLAVTLAAQSGQLELNAFLPLIAHALLGNLELLTRTDTVFRERCIEGLSANEARCADLLEHSHAQVTALVPVLGYELAADVAGEAQRSGSTVRAVVIARGLLAPAVLDRLLSADAMTALGYVKE
ncbi:aspartate ammonia-lyase [Propionivibrio soli]|uniref:aspartate ammonia-lyase n=1 Tax=Propionivibrio soli TaxID=2976531 RepID=UPI0021E6E8CC|nr:aspartate ammonia-lyase [Propionivibrio soli]